MAHGGQANPRKIAQERRKKARYRGAHRTLRQMLDPIVQAGLAVCVRCGEPIEPGAWDLGHDDIYPDMHSGPEHPTCNRGAPNKLVTSREW